MFIFFDFFYDKKFLEGIKFNNENNYFDFAKKIKINDEINNIKIRNFLLKIISLRLTHINLNQYLIDARIHISLYDKI